MPILTAGEECQLAAKTLSAFADPRQGAITAPFINSCMGLAILKGAEGVALVRLPSREWSAPCAIHCESPANNIQPGQETVILFMTERAIFSLVGQTKFILGKTHRFEPGPLYGGTLNLDPSVDVYAYVRFNNGFTPAELIAKYMYEWTFKEDPKRHARWHGKDATWFDVLTNKISVDRSSVGNALYLVLNMGTSGSTGAVVAKNYAKIEEWSKQQRSSTTNQTEKQSLNQIAQQQNNQQNMSNFNDFSGGNQMSNNVIGFDAQAMYQQQLQQQAIQDQMMLQNRGSQMAQQNLAGLGISQNQGMYQSMMNQPMVNQMSGNMGMNQLGGNMGMNQMGGNMGMNQMGGNMGMNQLGGNIGMNQPMMYQMGGNTESNMGVGQFGGMMGVGDRNGNMFQMMNNMGANQQMMPNANLGTNSMSNQMNPGNLQSMGMNNVGYQQQHQNQYFGGNQ